MFLVLRVLVRVFFIQRKLKFSNKQELVFWAVQNGLVGAGSEAS